MIVQTLTIGAAAIGVAALMLLGFVPSFVLHLALRVYPQDHERRRELAAEFQVIPRWDKPRWVGEQLGLVAVEGWPARRQSRQQKTHKRVPPYYRKMPVSIRRMRSFSYTWTDHSGNGHDFLTITLSPGENVSDLRTLKDHLTAEQYADLLAESRRAGHEI